MEQTYHEELLDDFITIFGASLDPRLWLSLIHEEVKEFREEFQKFEGNTPDLLKELIDVAYVWNGLKVVTGKSNYFYRFLSDDEYEQAMTDLLEVERIAGWSDTAFDDDTLNEAFDRVHQSNLSKLDDNGKPIRREDGKILKGPNYKPPFLDDLI